MRVEVTARNEDGGESQPSVLATITGASPFAAPEGSATLLERCKTRVLATWRAGGLLKFTTDCQSRTGSGPTSLGPPALVAGG